MQNNSKHSFAFLVLTYNHEDYIFEHLESIKYLVLTYGAEIDVDLIVNDDCSGDKTQQRINQWLQLNTHLFRYIHTLYHPKNIGTCASVHHMLSRLVADRCKMTAGDDVYSFENIFELTQHEPEVAMLSGRALYLRDNVLGVDQRSSVLSTATQVIYEKNSLLQRFKHFSYQNAPNLLYAAPCLLHPNVQDYLQRFDVTEDWPLQVAIARQFPTHHFQLIDAVLVYYRRTAGSTYIVANQRFVKDKILVYNDLIKQEPKWLERLRLQSRKACFRMKHKVLSKILNLDMYFFGAALLLNLKKIYSTHSKVNITVARHLSHYSQIKHNAEQLQTQLSNQSCSG
jgi:glycosyltransferase involved in cell wall biosynthesis